MVMERAPMLKTLLYLPFQECLITRKLLTSSIASVGEADPELGVEEVTTKESRKTAVETKLF